MTIQIVTPAPFVETRAMMNRLAAGKPLQAQVCTYSLAMGETFALVIEGDVLIVIGFWGLWPEKAGSQQLFFAAAEPARVVPHATALYRAGRLIVARRLQDASLDRLVAWTSSSAADFGHRLARKTGFLPCHPVEPPGGFCRWELRRPMDFSDALKHVKAGKYARRKAWGQSVFICLENADGDHTIIICSPDVGDIYRPSREDLVEDDWDSFVPDTVKP